MNAPQALILNGTTPRPAPAGKANFCAHPIKTTGSTFRKLMRRASLSLRPSHEKGSPLYSGSIRRGPKGKAPMGDGESGIVLDEKDTDDTFYAADAVAVRVGKCPWRLARLQTDSGAGDFVDYLPAEITAQIMSYLDHKSLVNCEVVSRDWHEAASNRHVWRNVFRSEHGPWESRPGRDWKRMFTVRKELDSKWQNAEVDLTYLKGHTDSVYCVQFDK